MTVHTFDPLADGRWAEVVRTHPRASVFHTPGWLDALRRTYGYRPVGFTTSPPGVPLTSAVVACEIRSWLTGRRLVSLPFADHCEPLIDDPADADAIAGELERRVEAGQWKSIECRPLMSHQFAGTAFKRATTYCFHSLDLRPPAEALFKRFHATSIQQTIRRAERERLQIEIGTSVEQLEKFYRLLLMTRRRHQIPPQPIDWFWNILDGVGARASIWLATKGDRTIGGIVLLRHRNTLVYKYGASDAACHNLGAMPFLLWNAIQQAQRDGITTLDLGRSDTENAGLITFKDRLGAECSMLRYLRLPLTLESKPHTRWGARLVRHLAAGLPDRVLISTGRLMYRHFG